MICNLLSLFHPLPFTCLLLLLVQLLDHLPHFGAQLQVGGLQLFLTLSQLLILLFLQLKLGQTYRHKTQYHTETTQRYKIRFQLIGRLNCNEPPLVPASVVCLLVAS